jgi:hypothetical protein
VLQYNTKYKILEKEVKQNDNETYIKRSKREYYAVLPPCAGIIPLIGYRAYSAPSATADGAFVFVQGSTSGFSFRVQKD